MMVGDDDIIVKSNTDHGMTMGKTKSGDDLEKWLKSIDMTVYLDKFVGHGYDKIQSVKEIKDLNAFFDVGIVDKDDQLKLLMEIRRLRREIDNENEEPAHVYPTPITDY